MKIMKSTINKISFLLVLILLSWKLQGQEQPIKVACVGNSVTFGYGLPNREAEAYPVQLQQLLGKDYQVGNFGHSGATLLSKGHRPYIEQQAYRDALAFTPDLVVIHLGLNDTDPRNWPNHRDEFIGDYLRLIDSYKDSQGNKPKVWICRMTPIFNHHPRFKSGTRDWFWQIQEAIETVAQNSQATLINLHSPLYSHPNLFADALHPDAEGAGIIARTVFSAITGDHGGLKPAGIFGNNMVLQQKMAIPVYGTANRGETITVKLNHQEQKTIAGDDGTWKVWFPPMKAGGHHKLEIAGEGKTIRFENILIGEVWLCSGQSNMEFPLSQSAGGALEASQANQTEIRLLNHQGFVKTNNTSWDSASLSRLNRLDYFEGAWQVCNPKDAANFSAVAYHFGKTLQSKIKVPVGIIQMAVGGSPAEAWIDRKTLEHHPQLVDILYHWRKNDMIQTWCRERAEKNISNGKNQLQRHPYEPAYLYESGIQQLAGFPIKGILWYQGESNAHHVELHEIILPTLVGSWRKAWQNPDLPFYFVQLSSLSRPSWPHFRDSQRRLAQTIPNCHMVVSSDLGDSLDVHPIRKQEVGKRLALQALKYSYSIKPIQPCGPEIEEAVEKNGILTLAFRHAKKLNTSDGQLLREIEIAGPDRQYKTVMATIKGNTITFPTNGMRVKTVRYAWRPYSRGNLVNEAGLPASTFEIHCK